MLEWKAGILTLLVSLVSVWEVLAELANNWNW
jgi:hypothetical protein